MPRDLVEAFLATRLFMDMHLPWVEQLVSAEFMAAGHFARHIRQMRTLYAARQAALVEAARPLAGRLEVRPAEAGMHLVGWLPEGSDDQVLAQLLDRHQVSTRPLSRFCLEPSPAARLAAGVRRRAHPGHPGGRPSPRHRLGAGTVPEEVLISAAC